MSQNAFVLGGTGMVGKQLVKQLISSPKYGKITLLTRRSLNKTELEFFSNSPKLNVEVVDFNNLSESKAVLNNQNVGFCCLGTTRAAAGSAQEFINIDHDIPLKVAQLFKEASGPGKRFSLLTSAGSDASSWFLYPKTKGQLENGIINLKFEKTSIFRPGLLIYDGERPQQRHFESFAIFLFNKLGIKKGSARVEDVATAMRLDDEIPHEGLKLYENQQIIEFSSQ
jgi:oxidoreductase